MNKFNFDTGEKYSYINFSPDESVSEENRSWQGCPAVAVTKGGRIFAGWYSGGLLEPCIHNYNILVKSDDSGNTWSEPILTIGTDYKKRMRNIDIELWITEENELWVTWVASPYYETSVEATILTTFERDYHKEFEYTEVMVCKNPDADELVWEEPRILCKGFLRNKPIKTKSGRIIAPGYSYDGEKYTISISDDNGKSFNVVEVDGKPDINVFDEIMVYENDSARLRFLARTNRGFYLYSDSFDGGNVWTTAQEYEKAPSTRCYIGKLKNGNIIYVRNISDEVRTGMKVCLSTDGGDTFGYELVIDERENISYPDVQEDEKGNIYIVYDRERSNKTKLDPKTNISKAAKEILICRITVDDIKAGKISDNSYLARVISKAKIDKVEK